MLNTIGFPVAQGKEISPFYAAQDRHRFSSAMSRDILAITTFSPIRL